MILRRFLRNIDPAPLFQKAMALLDPGWGMGIVRGGQLLAALGMEEEHLLRPGAVRFSSSLNLEGQILGHVVVLATTDVPSEFSAGSVQQVADLLAKSLEMLLGQEAARRSLASDTLQKYRELSLLHRATVALNASLRLRQVARALLVECQNGALPTEMGMIFLRETEAESAAPFASFGPAQEPGLARVAASTLYADIMRGQKAELISDLSADSRWHGEVKSIRALLAAPIVAAGERVGSVVLATARETPLEASHLQYLTTLTSVAGTAMGNAAHFEGVRTLLKALLQALATAIDARDPFTAGHSHRVARLAVALAKIIHRDRRFFEDVSFTAQDLAEIYYAGLLHDVGKIGVREQVLTKDARLPDQQLSLIGMRMALLSEVTGAPWQEDFEHLKRINRSDAISRDDAALVVEISKQEITAYGKSVPLLTEEETLALLLPRGNLLPEERREIERHPTESFRILQHIPFPKTMPGLLDIICQHHERLDGSGYPAGLRGGEISLMARLLMIVDIYDAITMERHYKPALSREKAVLILEDEAARGKLDERMVRLMAENLDEIEEESSWMAENLDFDSIITHNFEA
jgi:HD-GYP domain-containing protein (c-di-GMP phosphodiesterase class II)